MRIGKDYNSNYRNKQAAVAQLVEQCTENAWVDGSSPSCGTKPDAIMTSGFLIL
jgi:uncharacterized protein YbbK (DUF523 family)